MFTGGSRKPIGLDIGTDCIKAVKVTRRGSRILIAKIFERDIPREKAGRVSLESLEEQLTSLTGDRGFTTDLCVSSFPLHSAIVRNTVVPFSGRKKIQQVIKFQAEPNIPFPIEDVIIDFHEVEEGEEKKTPVIIIGAKKDLVRTHLDLLGAGGVDPEIVSVDAFALVNNYLARAGASPEEITVLLDLGATKTLLVLMRGSSVLLTRSILIGGDHLTAAIQKECSFEFRKAEEIKKEKASAMPGEGADADEKEIHKAIGPTLNRLSREIDRSIRSVSGAFRGETPSRVYLSGGGALLRGLRDYFSNEFGCEAGFLCGLSPFEGSADDETMCRMGIATGLALQGLGRGATSVNLRQEEFAFAAEMSRIRRQIVIASVLGACIAGILIYNFAGRFIEKRSRYNSLAAKLERVYRETFPRTETPPPLSIAPAMQKRLDEYEERYKNFSVLSASAISSLEILREISRLMPRDFKIQVVDMEINQDEVELEGLIDNSGDASAIMLKLAESPYFSKVGVPSTSPEGKKYQFELIANINKSARAAH